MILSSKKAPSVQKCILSRRGLLTSSCPTVKWLQVFLTVNFQKKITKNIFYKVGNLKSVYVCVYVYNTSFYIQFCCPKFLQLGNLAKISFFLLFEDPPLVKKIVKQCLNYNFLPILFLNGNHLSIP